MLLLVPALVFVAVLLLALTFTNPSLASLEARLNKGAYADIVRGPIDLSMPFTQRVIVPFFQGIAKACLAFMPSSIRDDVERRLALAGNPYGLKAGPFLFLSLVAGSTLPLLYIGAAVGRGSPQPRDMLLTVVLAGAGVWMLPRLWLGFKVSARQKQIERSLPDALDLITICVEAGLTLEAALARVVSRKKGPLSDELGRALQEIAMGKARARALRDVAKRTGVADLQSIIAALVQAEEMGSSIGNVLRVQSDSARVKRQQRAQEQAMQAPVKMLFPLVFFIMPAMFVVILGPAVIRIGEALFK